MNAKNNEAYSVYHGFWVFNTPAVKVNYKRVTICHPSTVIMVSIPIKSRYRSASWRYAAVGYPRAARNSFI